MRTSICAPLVALPLLSARRIGLRRTFRTGLAATIHAGSQRNRTFGEVVEIRDLVLEYVHSHMEL